MRTSPSIVQRVVALFPLVLSCGGNVSSSTAPPAETPSTFASSDGLVIDATSLYWIDTSANALLKAPRAGGSAQTLATPGGYGVAVDATEVFWIGNSPSQINRVSIAGGPSAKAADFDNSVSGFAVDGAHLYFSRGSQELVEMTLGTGATRTLTNSSALRLALDGDQIFGTSCNGDSVWRVPKAGGQRVVLVHDTVCPMTIATRGNYVYYANGSALWRVPRDSGCSSFDQSSCATNEKLAPIDGIQFAVDATSAYAFQSGALVRIPLDKSPTTKLANVAGMMVMCPMGQTPPCFAADGRGIAVDDARVYWIHGGPGPIVLESMPK